MVSRARDDCSSIMGHTKTSSFYGEGRKEKNKSCEIEKSLKNSCLQAWCGISIAGLYGSVVCRFLELSTFYYRFQSIVGGNTFLLRNKTTNIFVFCFFSFVFERAGPG